MTDIDTLRQRVEAAERAVGQYNSHDAEYSERLLALFGGIEQRLLEQRDQLRQRDGRIKALEHESRELRAMLHALLLAVEDGGRGRVGIAVGELEKRVSALVGDRRSGAEAVPATPTLETETAASELPEAATTDAGAELPEAEPEPEEAPAVSLPGPEPGADQEPEAEHAASSALDYGIEEEPDLAMPSAPPEAAADGVPQPSEAPEEVEQDDEAARLRLINELLGETEVPALPDAPTEHGPPSPEAQGAARPKAGSGVDDSVQQIIERVSRLVSDLSEQEDGGPPSRQTSAA